MAMRLQGAPVALRGVRETAPVGVPTICTTISIALSDA
jgi:hypothetical protein